MNQEDDRPAEEELPPAEGNEISSEPPSRNRRRKFRLSKMKCLWYEERSALVF